MLHECCFLFFLGKVVICFLLLSYSSSSSSHSRSGSGSGSGSGSSGGSITSFVNY